MIKNFTQVFDRLSAAGLKIKEVLNSCDQMRKYHLQILFGEVDAHLSGIIRNLKLSECKSEENDKLPEPEAPNPSRSTRKRKPHAWLHDYDTDM